MQGELLKDMTGVQKKVYLLDKTAAVKMQIRELQAALIIATPMATQLQVNKEMDKLQRQLEKVQSGLQELAL